MALVPYRRHREKCKRTSRRADCTCPIWVQGVLNGVPVRRSLDLTSWEAAQLAVRDLEIYGEEQIVGMEDACDAFITDCEGRSLSTAIIKKLKYVKTELVTTFGSRALRRIAVADLDKMCAGWQYAPSTTAKRIEYIRWFFSFFLSRDWIEKNPAKALKSPTVREKPTLPFTDAEMEKILWAAETYREIHPFTTKENAEQLKAIVLVMRYSGLRISDTILLRCDAVNYDTGNLFVALAGGPRFITPLIRGDAKNFC